MLNSNFYFNTTPFFPRNSLASPSNPGRLGRFANAISSALSSLGINTPNNNDTLSSRLNQQQSDTWSDNESLPFDERKSFAKYASQAVAFIEAYGKRRRSDIVLSRSPSRSSYVYQVKQKN